MERNKQKSEHHHSGHNHVELVKTLNECVVACEQCAAACLDEDNVSEMAHCIELDRDCADICALGARLLQRDSELAHNYLVACEEACRTCAEECRKHEHDHCKACAEACERCAEACHEHHGSVSAQ